MGETTRPPLTALGLMSGTSMDGIDLAVLTTDGAEFVKAGPAMSADYAPETSQALAKAVAAGAGAPRGEAIPAEVLAIWQEAERLVTRDHEAAINAFAQAHPDVWETVELIGFHGQTVLHRPDERLTVQLGDGKALANAVGRDVVFDFRVADVKAGGQGAPFAPLYHAALAAGLREERGLSGPIAALNMGGVGNVTWMSAAGDILAFDTGPANGPMDDWVRAKTGASMDKDGALARAGAVHDGLIAEQSRHPYFAKRPPKSLDRLDFGVDWVAGLSAEDGAATLTAFSADTVRLALDHMPQPPVLWVVCGGGRKNACLMQALGERLPGAVIAAEEAGWRGDDLEAEAFAYLAVRSTNGEPLSLPSTTGVPKPCLGGKSAHA